METGIYKITSPSGHFYIGSTKRSFKRRWQEHRTELKCHIHHNSILQAAWDKYGGENIKFEILWECEPERCEELEQFLLEEMKPEYNLAQHTDSPFRGRKHSDEAKKKCRLLHLGKKKPPFDEEYRKRIGDGHRGMKYKPRSLECRKKQSIAQIGRKHSPETKEKIRVAHLGRKLPPFTEKHKKALSEVKLGKCIGKDNPHAKSIICIETQEIFPTIREATKWAANKLNRKLIFSNICDVCKGRSKTAYGYHWKYAEK